MVIVRFSHYLYRETKIQKLSIVKNLDNKNCLLKKSSYLIVVLKMLLSRHRKMTINVIQNTARELSHWCLQNFCQRHISTNNKQKKRELMFRRITWTSWQWNEWLDGSWMWTCVSYPSGHMRHNIHLWRNMMNCFKIRMKLFPFFQYVVGGDGKTIWKFRSDLFVSLFSKARNSQEKCLQLCKLLFFNVSTCINISMSLCFFYRIFIIMLHTFIALYSHQRRGRFSF